MAVQLADSESTATGSLYLFPVFREMHLFEMPDAPFRDAALDPPFRARARARARAHSKVVQPYSALPSRAIVMI
jgi:hypothetical protein